MFPPILLFGLVAYSELWSMYLKPTLSGFPSAKDVSMKSKVSKNRLGRNSDTFSGISFAKDVVMKKLLIIQKTSLSCILCEAQLRNDEKMALCPTFIFNLIILCTPKIKSDA